MTSVKPGCATAGSVWAPTPVCVHWLTPTALSVIGVCGITVKWDHPLHQRAPVYITFLLILTDCSHLPNRGTDLPLLLLPELLMWGWSVWAPGELPSPSGRNIQMWVSLTSFFIIYIFFIMSFRLWNLVCIWVTLHASLQVFPVTDWDNTPACAVRWEEITVQWWNCIHIIIISSASKRFLAKMFSVALWDTSKANSHPKS